ncbi:MAG TPA: G1 family glutamic endopeptidase, partial [Candidatus Angelobacter sp.]|nr:G1 family glutamic endopeptidase [Candidatus Angelobacter sp.]
MAQPAVVPELVRPAESEPSPRIISLPSGASIRVFPAPPSGFNPLEADEKTLQLHGLPARPAHPEQLQKWEQTMSRQMRFIQPTFKRMERNRHVPRHRRVTDALEISDNWSGAAVFAPSGSSFESVAGQWTVPQPQPSSPDGTSYSSFWIGIDGDKSGDVFQAGVECEASTSGRNIYAWWEWFPEQEIQISNFPVSAGHILHCVLNVISNTSGSVLLQNLSNGVATTFTITAPSGTALTGNSAEWVGERPEVNNQLTHLADFGEVHFSNISAFTHQGITGFAGKVTLGDTSPVDPSLASLNGRLYLAWKGDGNNFLNVMYSADNGHTFAHKFVSPERSPETPVLCAHNGNLYIAWKGDGNDQLNVAQVVLSGDSITGFTNKVVLGDTSPVNPSLASLNGRLYLSWKGDGNNFLNVMSSADNGHTFGHKFTSQERSPETPVLCAHNGNLYIGWKGDGNDNLNVAQVLLSGDSITGFANKVILGDTSPVNPSLASLSGRLFLGWKG